MSHSVGCVDPRGFSLAAVVLSRRESSSKSTEKEGDTWTESAWGHSR
jgi:hypothetical protein